MKRAFDKTAAAVGLVALSPVIAGTAAAVAIGLGRPVLFRQTRPGLHGKSFQFLKFRSMRDAVDASGKPLPDAERLTPLGKFLRSSSLDELPQLWNVLRGDMSLVGPRPLLVQYLARYTSAQAKRHDVLPGITGWAQVNVRNGVPWDEKLSYDTWYVENWSLWLDAKILAKTVLTVVRRDGINQVGQVTTAEFLGSPRESDATHAAAGAGAHVNGVRANGV